MKTLLTTVALLFCVVSFKLCSAQQAASLPSPSSQLDAKPESLMPTKATNGPAQPPIKLESVAKPVQHAPERIPVYVIPELVLVQTPQGPLMFAPETHIAELVKKFPAMKVTNVVIYSK